MTDIEIDHALALAIGWKDYMIDTDRTVIWVLTTVATLHTGGTYKRFSHKDPAVIWPIAEKYSAFPMSISAGNFQKAKAQGYTDVSSWEVLMYNYRTGSLAKGSWVRTEADTAVKAVALAVIGMNK